MELESLIYHTFHGFSKATKKTDGSVAGFGLFVFPLLYDGHYNRFFPGVWKLASFPRLIVDHQ